MTAAAPAGYDRPVAAVRDALRCAAASIVLSLGFLHPAVASAASDSFALGDQAVVQVWAGERSAITIKAWDHPNVQFDTDDEGVTVIRRQLAFGTPRNPLSVPIPLTNIRVRDSSGGTSPGTLPPEDFPYASDFRAGIHDSLRLVTRDRSRITVMVPASVAILDTRIHGGAGILTINYYHGGTLFVGSNGGRTILTNVTSAAFIQMINGRLDVHDSSFDRLRARGNNVSMVFEHNRARQIEVTTVSGPIVYDNGTFDPGLARFESASGSIAIGVHGGARLAARASDGRVYSMWDKRTPLVQRSEGEASATVAGGGPLVNAVTGHGNVYLYDGALDTRRAISPEWRPIREALEPRRGREPDAFKRFRELRGRMP